MGLRERLGQTETAEPAVEDDTPVVIPSAWVRGPDPAAPAALALQPLGEAGFGLRHPEDGSAVANDGDYMEELGGVVTSLEDIGPRRDDARVLASAPGQVLSLVPEGTRRVAIYDRTGRHDIGYLDGDTSAAVAAALDAGIALRAVSLWETRAMDGQRTELRVLIVPPHVDLIVAGHRRIDLTQSS